MESKTLNTIQAFAKVGKVLSGIAYVCCLVGGILCLAGITCIGIPDSLKLGGVTIYPLIDVMGGVNPGSSYAALTGGVIVCIAGCVISKLAGRYFKNELDAGTPFTHEGANEMLRLGICTAAISLGSTVAAAVCSAMVGRCFGETVDLSYGDFTAFGLGIAFIVLSVIFRHGAEMNNASQVVQG